MARLQFELTEEKIKAIDELVERTGLKTRVQLLNAALTLFDWALKQKKKGYTIAAVNERRSFYKELEMPGLLSSDFTDQVPGNIDTDTALKLAELAGDLSKKLSVSEEPDENFLECYRRLIQLREEDNDPLTMSEPELKYCIQYSQSFGQGLAFTAHRLLRKVGDQMRGIEINIEHQEDLNIAGDEEDVRTKKKPESSTRSSKT